MRFFNTFLLSNFFFAEISGVQNNKLKNQESYVKTNFESSLGEM